MIVYYDESVLSYVASIRDRFSLSSSFEADPRFSEMIEKADPKRIMVLLIDGMGSDLLNRLDEDSFLRRHFYRKVTTVFPTTTTAATTSILNGKAPNENAWLGWMEYIKEADNILIPFLGKGYYDQKEYGPSYVYENIPTDNIIEELNCKGIKAESVYPAFRENGCATFEEMRKRLTELSYSDCRFIYAYWDEYDSLMHKHSPSSEIADDYLRYMDDQLKILEEEMGEDTMLIVLADHGQIDVEEVINLYGTDYEKYLLRPLCTESRAVTFYIKEGYKEEFSKKFKADFEEDFLLLSKEQIKKLGIFGPNKDHPRFDELIGDYLAIAKTHKCLVYSKTDGPYFKGQHAGMCEEELYIPIIVYNK